VGRGRPPLPPDQKREVIVKTRVKATAYAVFKAKAVRMGLNDAEAVRAALAAWVRQ
jgi:hypothetical protein